MSKNLLLIAFLTSTFIYAVNLWFSVSGSFVFLTTIFILGAVIFFPKNFKTSVNINFQTTLALVLFLFLLLSFSLEAADVNGELSLAMWLSRLLMFISTLIGVFYFLKKPQIKFLNFIFNKKFLILLVCSLVIQISLLRVLKEPNVDIFKIVKFGPIHLLSGQNPYDSPGLNNQKTFQYYNYEFYTYGPATIFLFLPSVILFGDPRILLIFCNFLIAFCLYKISKKYSKDQLQSEMLALIYLFHPRYPNLIIYSVTDVLIVGLLAFAFYSYSKKQINRFALSLGAVAGIKIFYALPLIFLLKYKSFPFKKILIIGLLSLLMFYLPFLIADYYKIFYSTVLFHLSQTYTLYLQQSVVTLASFINRQWGFFPPPTIFLVINLLLITFFWFIIKKTNNFSEVLVRVSFVFLVFLFFSQQALSSYYFTASTFILFALAFKDKD